MPLYAFETIDGCLVQRFFSVSDCPQQIVLDDGRVAKKIITCPNILNSPTIRQKIKKQQTQKNIDAGNRGRSYWKKQFGGS